MKKINEIVEIIESKIKFLKEMIACGSYDNDIYYAKLETLEVLLGEIKEISE